MRPTIYIAGPYSNGGKASDQQRGFNTEDAVTAAIELLEKGWAPYIPHLSHFFALQAEENGLTFTWREYMEWDDAFLACCDAILHLKSSTGADIEKLRATTLYKIPLYTKLDQVPDALVFEATQAFLTDEPPFSIA